MKFNPDLGVYVCTHVYEDISKLTEVIRDSEGYWQFLCGSNACTETSEPKLACISHLLEKDSSLGSMVSLKPGTFAERKTSQHKWEFGEL